MKQPEPPLRRRWPFPSWGVGDTEFFTTPIRRTQFAAHAAGRRHGWRFVTETRTEDGQRGVRVWRVA